MVLRVGKLIARGRSIRRDSRQSAVPPAPPPPRAPRAREAAVRRSHEEGQTSNFRRSYETLFFTTFSHFPSRNDEIRSRNNDILEK